MLKFLAGICHSESNTQTLRKSSIGDDCHSGDEEKSRKRMRRTAVLGRVSVIILVQLSHLIAFSLLDVASLLRSWTIEDRPYLPKLSGIT